MFRGLRTMGVTLRLAAVAVGLQLALVVSSTEATTITSADFTFGFGATGTGAAVWTTTENSANNSLTGQGDFLFSPSVSSSYEMSSSGCTFVGRTLADGGGGVGASASVQDPSFGVPIVASYTGAAPADADPTNPNYQLTLEITGLGVYVGDYSIGSSGGVAQWSETTAGHTQTSPVTTLLYRSGGLGVASEYTHMSWNPTDYSMALAGLNDSVTRSFGIPVFAGGEDYRYLDGIEVFGRIELSYNAVPEPSTCVLGCLGLVGLLAYVWRKQK